MSQLYRFCISLNHHHHLSFPSSLFSALLPFSIAFSAGPLQNWYLHSPDDYNRDYSFLFQFLASRKLFEQINRARILDRVTGMRGGGRVVPIQSERIFMHSTCVIEKVMPRDLTVLDCVSPPSWKVSKILKSRGMKMEGVFFFLLISRDYSFAFFYSLS